MPAKTGQDYVTRLRQQPSEVWIGGERVNDVTTHPAFRRGVASIAALYDMQHDAMLRQDMTSTSPTDGAPAGRSHLIPRSAAELEKRRVMMTHWAWASCGMMARTPDFLNVTIAAWGAA